MKFGPLEFVVIGFEGNRFTGEIVPQLQALNKQGIMRIVDLLFLIKDEQGTLEILEASDLPDEEAQAYAEIAQDLQGLMTGEDLQQLAQNMPPHSSAIVALLEHTWAIGLEEAIIKAGGKLLTEGLVPLSTQEEVEAELEASEKK